MIKDILSKFIFNILKNYMKFIIIYLFSLFLPGRMEIEKVEKLVANLHDKIESAIHIGNLEQVSNHGLVIIIKWLSLKRKLYWYK